MTGSPLNSLYHSVHSVYAPALLRNETGRQELSGKVQVSDRLKCGQNTIMPSLPVIANLVFCFRPPAIMPSNAVTRYRWTPTLRGSSEHILTANSAV